jgi:hypothetical protein
MTPDDSSSNDANQSACCIGFVKEFDIIAETISRYRNGNRQNIAIIGSPYSGKSLFLEHIREVYKKDTYTMEFQSQVKGETAFGDHHFNSPIIQIDGCQRLFSRRIEGFTLLDDFLMTIAEHPSLFITTWNLHAWNYLSRARQIERFFPVIVTIPTLSVEDMRSCILLDYTQEELQFIGQVEIEMPRLISFIRREIQLPLLKTKTEIPIPRFNIDALTSKNKKQADTLSDEEYVFQRITRLARGNPGVGKAIWKSAFEYPIVDLKSYNPTEVPSNLTRDDLFLLGVISMMGQATEDELIESVDAGDDIRSNLYRLLSCGLLHKADYSYVVYPEATIQVEDVLLNKRIFWE